MHNLGLDVGESGPAPWLRAFVDAGLVALERRLEAERIMDEIDEAAQRASPSGARGAKGHVVRTITPA